MQNTDSLEPQLGTEVPRWSPSARELDDAESILLGAYSPLSGFLSHDDLSMVRTAGRLVDGRPWPVPVGLRIPVEVAAEVRDKGSLLLLDEEGTPVALLTQPDLWHDGDAVAVAGPLTAVRPLERGSYRALRRQAPSDAATPVLGVVVTEPPHRPQVAQWRLIAAGLRARVLLLPLTGSDREGPVDGGALVRICLGCAPELGAEVLPVAVPHHGDADRDRLLAAHVARAYGATHVPGSPAGLPNGLAAVALPDLVLDRRNNEWIPPAMVPAEVRSDVTVREVSAAVDTLLLRGRPVPSSLTFPSVVRELTRSGHRHGSGFTVLLSGLSGSGKSTIAKALHAELLDRTARTVTLLDGDLVRTMLSSELSFSREHRELNVQRIGFVAAEVTRHGGIALCAPIAPYARMREGVRNMVDRHGGFLLVHVATALEVCESRDRKGLYAKARAGLVPEFTGVSDPYEVPTDADLTIDTNLVPVDDAVQCIMSQLVTRGWLTVD